MTEADRRRAVWSVHEDYLDFLPNEQPHLQGFDTVMEMFVFKPSGGLSGPANISTAIKFVTKAGVMPYLAAKTRCEASFAEAEIVPCSGPIG